MVALRISRQFVTWCPNAQYKPIRPQDRAQPAEAEEVTESDLTGLPEPVQRWLRYSGVVGRERAQTVRLKEQGYFRRDPECKWMPYEAEQYYTTKEPAFVWSAHIKAAPLFNLHVRDKYERGHGNMRIKLWSLIPIGNETAPELDQGALLRFLNETMWFPGAAMSDYISWESVNDSSAKATMDYKGVEASAVFYFDEEGYELRQWSTPISEYGEFDGIRVPVKGEGIWEMPSGDFPYIRLEITDIEYNVSGMYGEEQEPGARHSGGAFSDCDQRCMIIEEGEMCFNL